MSDMSGRDIIQSYDITDDPGGVQRLVSYFNRARDEADPITVIEVSPAPKLGQGAWRYLDSRGSRMIAYVGDHPQAPAISTDNKTLGRRLRR